jgi:penicillin-binding protein 2
MRTINNKYVKPSYAVDVWSDHLKSFGLGDFMGYDLPTGKEEIFLIPKRTNMYPNGGWRIPQSYPTLLDRGETPIQLASMMATVANEGYYYASYHQKLKNCSN